MGSLAGKSPANTYKSLLKVADETNGISTSASQIEDGEGTKSCLYVSDDGLLIRPVNDNTTTTFFVRGATGTGILAADTSNNVVKVGSTQTPANSQILEFHAKSLAPTAGTHYFVSRPDASYFGSAVETTMGTGTDPDTSLDAGATTDDLLQNIFIVPVNSTIDAVKFIVSTATDTDTIINVHLYKFLMVNAGGTSDGNLESGTLLAHGQATAVDRNVIKTVTCTVDSASVSAGEVIACFVENETNTDSVFLQTQVLYHFD
mgnify:FL=1|tara:strand:+ start:337 stop:1119 length:783 start_codon:yes stop_codon:yes gene_type:complete